MQEHAAFASTVASSAGNFAPLSAQRLFVIGGISLIVAGMVLGDIFAAFILHPNAGRIGGLLADATQAVAARNPQKVQVEFNAIGGLLENRGTKVDAHAHIIDFGYLALLLALAQPWVGFSERYKQRLAQVFLTGAVLLPVGVFLIHYVGLAYSPLSAIGWASIVADFGGLLVLLACAAELGGIWKSFRVRASSPAAASSRPGNFSLWDDRSWSSRALLSGGTLLILAGFIYGGYFAGAHLYSWESRDTQLLRQMMSQASAGHLNAANGAVNDYGALQGEVAINIAAHAHIIEFGFTAMLLALIQPYVFLSERWRRRWAVVLLAGSVILPVFVRMELRWGLLAGGIADLGGLLVIIALLGMLAGVLRYTGKQDAAFIRTGDRP
jgi:hypothetical protein